MADKAAGAPYVALVVGPQGAYAVGPGVDEPWPLAEVGQRFASASSRLAPRWVVWSAASTLRGVVEAGVDVARTWDLAETHRIIHGGWAAGPGDVLAGCRGLDPSGVPQPRAQRLRGFDGDLFDLAEGSDATLLTPDGHLRADALTRADDGPQLRELARLALECQASQLDALGSIGGEHAARLERTAWSESAAAVLCLELERDGLPVDRLAAEDLISASAGPRARDEVDAARIRSERDARVLRHAPGRERVDLRNPTQVRTDRRATPSS